jgi:hypothetical protein
MKTKLKSKPRSKKKAQPEAPYNVFTPMETGQPDRSPTPGPSMPWGAQGGLGPLNQEGEGELQNDQLAALEQFDPEK